MKSTIPTTTPEHPLLSLSNSKKWAFNLTFNLQSLNQF